MPRGNIGFRSVRTRLAVWHTAVLALVLVAFTVATWAFLDRLTRERVDRSLAEAARAFHQAMLSELRTNHSADQAALEAAQAFRFSGRRVLVYGAHHSLLAVSDSASDRLTQAISAIDRADDSPLHPLFASLTLGASAYATIGEGTGGVRAYATSVQIADQTFTIVALQVGLSERSILATFLQATAIAIPLALIVAGLGGYLLAQRTLAPVIDMGRRASAIDSESLDTRLAVRGTGDAMDELDELATVFNDMLGRLERSFVQQRQFMADASHELRTPLASLRAEASVTLSQPRTSHEYASSLEHMRNETRRLSAIVDDLFTLARLDAEDTVPQRREIYLEEQVMACVGRLYPLAQDRGLSLTFHPSSEAHCRADPELIDRVITNLLDNAIKYTPRGGSVAVEIETVGNCHVVRVTDDGTGIPAAAQLRVFDRFFRADEARARPETQGGGAGLGLSIAWEIARAHGGDLLLTSSSGRGTVFTLTLPKA